MLLKKYLLNSVKRQEINNYDHWKRLVGLIPLWGESWERKSLMQPENKFSWKRRRVFIIIWWFETRSLKFRYFRMKTVEGRVSFAKILRKAKNCDGGNGSSGNSINSVQMFSQFSGSGDIRVLFSWFLCFYYLFSLNWVHSVWPRCYAIYWSPKLFVS